MFILIHRSYVINLRSRVYVYIMKKGGAGTDRSAPKKTIQAAVTVALAAKGVGTISRMFDGFTMGCADAVLAASIFVFHEISIAVFKRELAARGVPVRYPF